MTRQLTYGTVREHSRKVIYVLRVLDELLNYAEVDHLAAQMRSHVTSRYGEQTPNVVIVQGYTKETLRCSAIAMLLEWFVRRSSMRPLPGPHLSSMNTAEVHQARITVRFDCSPRIGRWTS